MIKQLTKILPLALSLFAVSAMLIPKDLQAQQAPSPVAVGDRNNTPQGRVVIKGRVIDAYSKQPLVGATIMVADRSTATSADYDGAFTLKTKNGYPVTIEIVYIGYKTRSLTLEAEQKNLVIDLEQEESKLDEVVIVGYSQAVKNALTSATTTVKADQLKNIAATNVNDKLQGAVPGLLISSNAGIPGASSLVRLRGATSISAANTPIYVVDGVFINTDQLQRTDLGGMGVDPLSELNPEDIESVTVLKDASATAAYGARAANGVILIKTKRGQLNSQTKINFKMDIGWARSENLWELVTGPEHAEIVNAAWLNDGKSYDTRPFRPQSEARTGYPAYGTPEEQQTYSRLPDVFRTALQQTYNLSVTGGSDKTNFYIGGEYTKQDATLRLIDFERTSFRINLDHSIRDNIRIGVTNTVSYTSRSLMRIGDGPAGLFQAALHTPTFYPVYKEDGSYNKPVSFDNHKAILENWDGGSVNFRSLNSLFVKWDIIEGLSFRSSFNNDRSVYQENFYYNTYLIYGQPNGAAREGKTTKNIFSTEQVLNYFKTIGENHTVSAFLGASYQVTNLDRSMIEASDFPSNSLKRISSSAVQSASADGSKSALASVFGGVNYSYANRYSIDLTLREDGSSRVGKNNRWGYFPAVGFAWNIMNEKFFPKNDYVNDLRMKASLGLGGNENIGNYASLSLWRGGSNYNGSAGLAPYQLGNPDLKWETTRQWNVGISASLFKNHLDVEFDYYDKYTYDLLINETVPSKTGFTSIAANDGTVTNRGVELSLSSLNLQRSGLTWRTTFTLAHNKNNVKRLPVAISGGYTPFKLFEGYPMYSMWVFKYLGVDPQTGDAIYYDKNEDGKITADDKVIVGNAWPKVEGILKNTITYGNISIDFSFYYKYGNKVFNYTRMFLESGGTRGVTRSMQKSSVNYWKQPGDTGVLPRPKSTKNADGSSNYEGQSSRMVEDGSYIRLKNITVAYTLPVKWIQRIGLQQATVKVSANNLFLWTKYTGPDPEVNVDGDNVNGLVQGMDFGMPPQPRSIMFGINLTF